MDKKLYRVKVILYILAENEAEARMAATHANFDIFECTARKADRLDPGWEDAIPYNSEDGQTCAELFSDQDTKVIQPSAVPVRRPARAHNHAAIAYGNS